MANNKTIVISIRLAEEDKAAIEQYAKEQDLSMS